MSWTLLADLDARGLIHDTTDRTALAARLERPITLYHGIDPTADSLHIGNLLGLIMLRRFLDAGHRVLALAGGATGMIGDPSGRSEERNLLDEATLRGNVASIKEQIARVLGPGDWELVDNYDWTRDVTLLDFLRDVGKHVTVNQMVSRESVRQRMASEHGISFTEFSYMLLQAYDYWWLHEHHRCELQIGGSDQWGNIIGGVDLIRRRSGATVHALCWPLLTAPDGTKLGKSTGGRIWLDAARTTPFELYTHYLNTDDSQLEQLLAWFTLLSLDEIDAVMADHRAAADERRGQQRLAYEVTAIVHGREVADEVASTPASTSEWGQQLHPDALAALERTLPVSEVDLATELALVDALVTAGLAASKSAARRLVEQGGVYVNEEQQRDPDRVLVAGDRIDGRWVLLRAGKKRRHLLVYAG